MMGHAGRDTASITASMSEDSGPTSDRLEIRHPDGTVSKHEVGTAAITIGRSRDCDLQLDSNRVSRTHARMSRDSLGRICLTDLASYNGTWVNAERIGQKILGPMDVIGIGDFRLTLVSGMATTLVPAASTVEGGRMNDQVLGPLRVHSDERRPAVTRDQLDVLFILGRRLASTEDPASRLQVLCELMVGGAMRGQAATVVRIDTAVPQRLPQIVCPAEGAPGFGTPAPHLSRTVLTSVSNRKKPVMASNVGHAAGHEDLSIVFDGCVIACPLLEHGSELDVLYFIVPPSCGTDVWLALAALAAEQFLTIERNWIDRLRRREHAIIERELERGREIQQSLLPADLGIDGLELSLSYRPCLCVGGDYIGVVPRDDGRVLLAVADVSGKGLQAAIIASSVSSLIYGGTRMNLSLTDILRTLNDWLCRHLPSGRFVTMTALILEPATGRFRYANAGHMPPIVVDPDGAVTSLPAESNLVLGLNADEPFSELEHRLEPGHLLAMFTDGITELRGNDGELLETEGFTLMLQEHAHVDRSTDDIKSAIEGALEAFEADDLAQDDRALMLVRRQR